mmetsp:Transcript_30429/g.73401  ORF Transcript_30429/g.73401 Transcript_30429/m.73401 type:complete len:350 (+) Transcript_30429:198-1247(+)|eukprot:CAMPEP_0181108366 /NCGR_PEP_ID=MMETSP1071-20121207/17593_1 /TAXON_ID=35127 /ORGANISM="Thalassiosira sp., Strain NH16" /LENGTH=349 /DNA_ID=CAMNT_0023191967 /DNA_START=108 /DNA_END=1157 /DNA_ORIENTATION=-
MTSSSSSSSNTSITDVESATPSIVENGAVVDVIESHSLSNVHGKPGAANFRKLSTVSKMYDVDGDGKLDAAELAMRAMDKSGRGYLTNDTVYKMMKEQLETQKQLFHVKRVMIVLLALVFILAVSNLGTSFAAAALSKDTATSSSAQIVDKKTDEELSTQSSTNLFEFQRAMITPDGRRRLVCDKTEGGDVDCALSGSEPDGDGGSSSSVLTIDADMCKKVLRKCKRGNTVTLTRLWRNDDRSDYEVCPYSGTLSKHNKSTLTNHNGDTFVIEPIEGGHCRISGDVVLQQEGGICDVENDCASGLGCKKVEKFISACQRHCGRLRYAPRMVKACKRNCDHLTCQANDVE